MICKICGKEAAAGEVTCSGCGNPLPMSPDESEAPYAIWQDPGSRTVKLRFGKKPPDRVRSVRGIVGTWDRDSGCWLCRGFTVDELRQLMDDAFAGRDAGSVGGDGTPYLVWRGPGTGQARVRFGGKPSEQVRTVLWSIGTWDRDGGCWTCGGVTEDELRQILDDAFAGRDTGSAGGDGTPYLVWRDAGTGQVKVKFDGKPSWQVRSVLRSIGKWDRKEGCWICGGVTEDELRQIVDAALTGRDT